MEGLRLIVGLGNPGQEYARTRHNAGFRFVDALAEKAGGRFGLEGKLFGETARIDFAGRTLWLLKPATFMNHSGKSVAAVLRALVEEGGRVFDTAPSYGASEAVAGRLVSELGIAERVFWATKLNVARGGKADPKAALAQLEESFARIKKSKIDLIQVHNLGDLDTQYPLLKELKQDGRVRYTGVTTTIPRQYDELERFMRRERPDFIGIDYAIDNRTLEERVLPLAAERGIAVMVYAPFGRTRLWDKVRGRQLPTWAAEFDAHTWAQFFLKFVISHPAVTVTTPATSRVEHMVDNLGAALGRLPDEEMRRWMVEFIEEL